MTVKECARHSGLKSRSANNTGSMRFGNCRHDHGRPLNQSEFRLRAEVPFPPARQLSEYKGKGTSASREETPFITYVFKLFCTQFFIKVFASLLSSLLLSPFGCKVLSSLPKYFFCAKDFLFSFDSHVVLFNLLSDGNYCVIVKVVSSCVM